MLPQYIIMTSLMLLIGLIVIESFRFSPFCASTWRIRRENEHLASPCKITRLKKNSWRLMSRIDDCINVPHSSHDPSASAKPISIDDLKTLVGEATSKNMTLDEDIFASHKWNSMNLNTSHIYTEEDFAKLTNSTSSELMENDVSNTVVNALMPPSVDSLRCDDQAQSRMMVVLNEVKDKLYSTNGTLLAASYLSQCMGEIITYNIPNVTASLIIQNETLMNDEKFIGSYKFVLEFLEIVSNEVANRGKNFYRTLQNLMQAMKISPSILDRALNEEYDKISTYEFMTFLDSEISGQPEGSQMREMLNTLHMRIFDEIGKRIDPLLNEVLKLLSLKDQLEIKERLNMLLSEYSVDKDPREVQQKLLTMMTDAVDSIKKFASEDKVDPQLLTNGHLVLSFLDKALHDIPSA